MNKSNEFTNKVLKRYGVEEAVVRINTALQQYNKQVQTSMSSLPVPKAIKEDLSGLKYTLGKLQDLSITSPNMDNAVKNLESQIKQFDKMIDIHESGVTQAPIQPRR